MSSSIAASPVLAEAFTEIATALRRSTVQVRGEGPGGGSGVIWTADGTIITNAHVARETSATVELWDGRIFEAKMLARDTQRDLAILKIAAEGLPVAQIGDSNHLRIGQLVLAVGNPLGTVGAVTAGIIHATPNAGPNRQEWVAADITLAPGNSGGPLVDAEGRVLGINSMIAGGLGLAVPSNAVGEMLLGLEQRPVFGVTIQPVRLGGEPARLGLIVLEVATESAAATAGLMLGDVLTGTNGMPFSQPTDLIRSWRLTRTGETLTVNILRGGQPTQVMIHATVPEAVAA